MAKAAELQLLLNAKDQASGALNKLNKTLNVLKVGALAVAGIKGLGAIGKAIGGMVDDAENVSIVAKTFDNLARSVGGSAAPALASLREATRGLVSDGDLMQAGNKFLAMGIANSVDEMEQLTEMATQLGMAMGSDATSSM